jgi:hypothetical protein
VFPSWNIFIIAHLGAFVKGFFESFLIFFSKGLVSLDLLTSIIIHDVEQNFNRQNAQGKNCFWDFFVQFAERPCERKNTVTL